MTSAEAQMLMRHHAARTAFIAEIFDAAGGNVNDATACAMSVVISILKSVHNGNRTSIALNLERITAGAVEGILDGDIDTSV